LKELTIHHLPADERTIARVRVSYRPQEGAQAQEREIDFGFGVTEKQRRDIQWYLEEYLIYPWGEFRNRAQQVEKLMEQLGVELFDAVFGSRETAALYAHIADDLANTRIVIHADDSEGIALPWELMRDSARGDYGDLARLAHAFVRSQPDLIFQPPPALTDDEKFNILMIICRPGGPEGDVPFQSVARPLLERFRPHRDRIRLDILRPPTFEQLARVLNDKPNFYHVLHFDGHGAFPQGAGTHGLLLFEGENDESRRVTGAELGSLLAGKGVRVVLLNACQSGMTHPEAIYPSVGNELLKAGARGVVAMAYSVYVQSAVRFMARLYEGLIKGQELARAVALAREDLRAHPQRQSPIGEIPLRDWVVPVLFEAAPVKATAKPLGDLRLSPDILKEQQATADTEIDCPEPPAFGFVGRDGVTLDLERAFRTETIVLLEGMAGVGKTEMAAGFARWWAETGALDGPIFFFRFEHYLPLAQVCDRVGQVFGSEIRRQLNVEWHLLNADQRRQVALSVLKQVPCMLIWDNFEPVAGFPAGTQSSWKPEEQKELRDFLLDLHDGRTKALITSRRDESWLGSIYRRVQLGGLKLIEAQELAVRVMERAGLKPQQIKLLSQYNELLKYLRGNPLAIQTILPELKRTTPDALLSALRGGEVKLSDDDPAQGRERSLSASLTYRLDALDATLRQRLGVLALFQGFVDADVLSLISRQVEGAPDAINGLGRDQWIKMLDAAMEVGLLRHVGEGYYNVHPALPWFFYDLLREAFPDHLDWLEKAFCRAYSTYGVYLNKMFKTSAESVISLLRAEESNMIYALHLARKHQLWDDVQGIIYALQTLFVTQGRWVEWERITNDIQAEITNEGGEPLNGRIDLWMALLGHQAEIAGYRRDFNTWQTILLRLKDHFESAGDDSNLAVAFHQLGMIAQERRQFDEAERWYRQSLAIEERIGNEHGQGSTLHQLGRIAQERRQFDEAERWYRQSLAIEERIGDEYGQASTLHQLGRIAQERRQFDEAERWYRQSLAIKERIGDEYGQAITLHQLGTIAEERRQFDEAERWYRQSLAIKERIGDERGQASTLHQLGIIAQERRQFDEAERWYRQSLAIEERIGNEHGQAGTLHQLGSVAQKQRQFDEAERWYRQSLAISERIGNKYGQAASLYQLGTNAEDVGNSLEAIAFYKRAEELVTNLNDPYHLEMVQSSLKRVRGE
jgi:tetratricopeptide (TPR) repeat protein